MSAWEEEKWDFILYVIKIPEFVSRIKKFFASFEVKIEKVFARRNKKARKRNKR